MNKKQIVLIGGGGHCASCIEVIESTNEFEIAGIIDIKDKIGQEVLGYKIFACDDDLEKLKENYDYALITVGQIKSANLRKKLFFKVKEIGFELPVIIASTAYISKHSGIGEGTIIMHQAMINANVKIGTNNIINTKSLIEHDCKIGDNNHISTNVSLNGTVFLGDDCFIGSGTTVNDMVTIENNCIISSASLVRRNLNKAGIYIGNPLRKINE